MSVTEFDVRHLVRDADKDNAIVQATYDTVNRMVALIGDVSFEDLFTMPWGRLMQRLTGNVGGVHARGLLSETAAPTVREHLCRLGEDFPEFTFASFGGPQTLEDSGAVLDALTELWRQGVYFGYAGGDPVLQEILGDLLDRAPGLTYCHVFTTPKAAVTEDVVDAVLDALEAGLLFEAINNRCCNERVTPQDCKTNFHYAMCYCAANSTGACGTTADVCGSYGCCIGSYSCGRPPRPRRQRRDDASARRETSV
jgi:hypothetical protein